MKEKEKEEMLRKYLEEGREYYHLLLQKREMMEDIEEPARTFRSRSRFFEEEKSLLEARLKMLEEEIKEIERRMSEIEKSGKIPLKNIEERFGLSDLEKKIILILLFEDARGYPNILFGSEILKLFFSNNEVEILENRKVFYKESPLRKNRILILVGQGDTILDSTFKLNERFIREALGEVKYLKDKELETFEMEPVERWERRRAKIKEIKRKAKKKDI